MSDVSQHEQLLTALVDGELSGEHRARAEKLLAENPQYQALVQQWRRQSIAIRSLPKFQLDPAFATRVMSAVAEKTTPWTPTSTSPMSQWRTGFAAIVTLAAMLLLTLFVFPRAGEFGPMVKNVAVAPEADTGDTMDRMKSDSVPVDSPISEILTPENGQTSLVAKESVEPAPQGQLEQSVAGVMSRSAKEYQSDGSSKESAEEAMKFQSAPSKPLPAFSGVAATADPAARRPDIDLVTDGPEAAMDYKQAGVDLTGRDALNQVFVVDFRENSQPLEIVSEIFTRNEIQILQDESANTASSAPNFQGVEAGIRNAKPKNVAGKMASEPGASIQLTKQSTVGLEALYVVATPSQMRQAIQEISNQANVSGYQVPQQQTRVELLAQNAPAQEPVDKKSDSPLEKDVAGFGNAPNPRDPKSMSDLIEIEKANQKTSSRIQDQNMFRENEQPDTAGLGGGGMAGRGGMGADQKRNASATQLRPYESGNQSSRSQVFDSDSNYPIEQKSLFSPPAGGSSGEAAVADKAADPAGPGSRMAGRTAAPSVESESSDPKSNQAGNFGSSAANQEAAKIDDLFSPLILETKSEEELVKYLLLVRAAPTPLQESPPAPAKKSD